MSARVFVSVGTDHHPFGRLIDWIDRWASEHPDVELVVQHGYSPPSASGENHAMMTGEELKEHYGRADVVVSQVGPGTIADANGAGLVPIVIPRDPALGEVVDGHQYAFGEFMAARGRCLVVTSEPDLRTALDEAVQNPDTPRFHPVPGDESASVAMAALVTELMTATRRRADWRRVVAMLRRPPSDTGPREGA